MSPKFLLAVAAVLLLAACGDDGEGDATPTTDARTGCPVASDVVADAVGHPVTIDGDTASAGSCVFVGADEASAGARADVVVRTLDGESFTEVLAQVERDAGPTVELPDGLVDGAERGWLASVGRAVQVGALDGETLVIVAVTDPLLDADAAQEVAGRLAGEALGS